MFKRFSIPCLFALLWLCGADACQSGATSDDGADDEQDEGGVGGKGGGGGSRSGGSGGGGAAGQGDNSSGGGTAGGAAGSGGSGGMGGGTAGAGGSGGAGGMGGGTAGAGGSGGASGMGGAGMAGAGGTPGTRDLGSERNDFFGQSRCAGSGLLFCEDFEGASIDTQRWQVGKAGSNVVELTSAEKARGSKSLHLVANNNYAYVKTTKVFPIADDVYWARMFVRVKRFSTVAWAHWTLAEAAGMGDGSLIRVGGQYNTSINKNRWGVGSDGGPTGDWTRHDNDPAGAVQEPAVGQWVCLEWLHDGKNDVTRFYVDAVEHPSLATSANNGNTARKDVPYVMPSFRSLWFGWWQYQSDPTPFELWIDEIAVDGKRIGCKL